MREGEDDLVCEMDWEDHTDFLTLEAAGLEEDNSEDAFDCVGEPRHNEWFYDGESSEFTD